MTDNDLKRRVELFLQQKGLSSLPRVSIQIDGGQVILRGTVRSFYERQLCLSCRHVAGVLRVVDELEVDLPPQVSVSV